MPRWVASIFALALVAGSLHFFLARRGAGPEVRIGADGRYYWAYLTSLALDHDLDFENQYANPESGNYYKYSKTPTGRYANPFTMGPAVLWLPFFAVGHGVAKLVSPLQAVHGTSHVEQLITLYGSVIYSFLAGLLAYFMAARRHGPGAALSGALCAMAGGPLLQYSLNQPAYAHAPSAFAVVLLLFFWDRGRGERSVRGWVLIGALIGLAMLVRTQNMVFAAPALVEGIARVIKGTRQGGAKGLVGAALGPTCGALTALLVFFPQALAWKVIYGSWFTVPQGPGYMQWAEPLWAETLFSSRNGLFPHAPLWALGVLGLLAMARRDPPLFAALLGTLALAALVNGASSDWSGGGAFGGRRYDGIVAHVTLGVSALVRALVDNVERRPRRAAGLSIALVILFFIAFNYLMADEYRKHRIPPSESKDMLGLYNRVFLRMARTAWKGGNPLSWPAAWAFAWRTGAPASSYDEVVGRFFLTDFRVEKYRARSEPKKDALALGDPAHAKFIVHGFGPLRKEGNITVRPAVGSSSRLIVPTNHDGGAAMRLVGKALLSGTLRVLWNGHQVATSSLVAGEAVDLPFELDRETLRRGINVIELVHDGVPPRAEAVLYQALQMEER
ncbi:MAG: glycosyltransferase family 39 protein [Deltaproteobacteria bacterium]|nr:glycosyltransferase family 39 protein [Deltaproteobacteria bacterium]